MLTFRLLSNVQCLCRCLVINLNFVIRFFFCLLIENQFWVKKTTMDDSTISKMQLHYWEAKQTFLKKIKRKEDDFIVASDAELDAKLEVCFVFLAIHIRISNKFNFFKN